MDVNSFSSPKLALIFSSIKSGEIPLVTSSIRPGLRHAEVSALFFLRSRTFKDARFYCISFCFLEISGQGKSSWSWWEDGIYTVTIVVQLRQKVSIFTTYEAKAEIKQCVCEKSFVLSLRACTFSVLLECCVFLFADGVRRSCDRWQDAILTISKLPLALRFCRFLIIRCKTQVHRYSVNCMTLWQLIAQNYVKLKNGGKLWLQVEDKH